MLGENVVTVNWDKQKEDNDFAVFFIATPPLCVGETSEQMSENNSKTDRQARLSKPVVCLVWDLLNLTFKK